MCVQNGFYPFSWLRSDLTTLIDGHEFDWSETYAFHFFHSQSNGMLRYYDSSSLDGMPR
jgi:hypothetical protein